VAASAVAGALSPADAIPARPAVFAAGRLAAEVPATAPAPVRARPTRFSGRVWVINRDDIDTDMIYHNRYLTITDLAQMGQYTFDGLAGYETFASKAGRGDIVVAARNFGAGSSRQQAVDCFASLGIACIVAESFGSIFERNAINSGFPVIRSKLIAAGVKTGQEIVVDLETGRIELPSGEAVHGLFSDVQMEIYKKGGLLKV
jgi:3-isopropylmalate dehydratase small subunit